MPVQSVESVGFCVRSGPSASGRARRCPGVPVQVDPHLLHAGDGSPVTRAENVTTPLAAVPVTSLMPGGAAEPGSGWPTGR